MEGSLLNDTEWSEESHSGVKLFRAWVVLLETGDGCFDAGSGQLRQNVAIMAFFHIGLTSLGIGGSREAEQGSRILQLVRGMAGGTSSKTQA